MDTHFISYIITKTDASVVLNRFVTSVSNINRCLEDSRQNQCVFGFPDGRRELFQYGRAFDTIRYLVYVFMLGLLKYLGFLIDCKGFYIRCIYVILAATTIYLSYSSHTVKLCVILLTCIIIRANIFIEAANM